MRYIFLGYICIVLLILSAFFLLSFNTGFGYVFVQWHGWQIQTNVLVSLNIFLLSLFLTYLVWLGLKRILRVYLQKYEMPKSFAQLHPYERLGILWLLHAEREQQHIADTYRSSFILYPLIRARIALTQEDTINAKAWLKDQNTPLFELAELLKIDIALCEKEYAVAMNRLEFLSVQPLSPWLTDIEQAYQGELKEKWLQFLQQCPWWVFKTSYQIEFNAASVGLWLTALLAHVNEATPEDQNALSTWYHQHKQDITHYYIDDKITLLKLISQYELMNQATFLLAQDILQYRFVPEVLYIWLDKGLHDVEDVAEDITGLEIQIDKWGKQYPAQASLNFAQWHIFQKMHQYDKAQQLLALYPDDPYMSYLRLNRYFEDSHQLKNDLKVLMRYSGQNFKFDL